MKKYTWDEIYERAEDKGCFEPELRAKDEARWQVRNFALEHGYEDLEEAEIPEERVEDYCNMFGILFDEKGNIVSSNIREEKEEFKTICHPIPTWELCDGIGLDTETAYILDLTTEENFDVANEYLKRMRSNDLAPIDKKYIGDKVIMEIDTDGGDDGFWYMIHGNIDEYFESARKELERCIADIN